MNDILLEIPMRNGSTWYIFDYGDHLTLKCVDKKGWVELINIPKDVANAIGMMLVSATQKNRGQKPPALWYGASGETTGTPAQWVAEKAVPVYQNEESDDEVGDLELLADYVAQLTTMVAKLAVRADYPRSVFDGLASDIRDTNWSGNGR